jgi:hypothetical protein
MKVSPREYLRLGYLARVMDDGALINADADEANDESWGIADMLVVSDDRGQEQAFWDREAKAMLAGLVLYVVAHEEGPQRTLARVRSLLSATPDQFEGLLKDMTSSSAAHGLVARHANQMLSMEARLLSQRDHGGTQPRAFSRQPGDRQDHWIIDCRPALHRR